MKIEYSPHTTISTYTGKYIDDYSNEYRFQFSYLIDLNRIGTGFQNVEWLDEPPVNQFEIELEIEKMYTKPKHLVDKVYTL